jgi:hypothetical protein
VQRHFLLVAEPPRGDGAQSELIARRHCPTPWQPIGAVSVPIGFSRRVDLAKAVLKSDRGVAIALAA